MQDNREAKVKVINLTKKFDDLLVLDDISFEVKKGEFLCIVGPTGCGKTTFLNSITKLYKPTSGEILVNGKQVVINNPNDANELGIGMVHQHFQLVHNFTVTENIILGKEGGFFLDLHKAEKKIKEFVLKSLKIIHRVKSSDDSCISRKIILD